MPSRAGVFEILGVESTLVELVKTAASNLNFTSLAFPNEHEHSIR
jgi:hypothetical protein